MAHDDVIPHLDLEQRARFADTFGEPAVGVRRIGLAAGGVCITTMA